MKKLLFISKNLEIGGMEKALVILLNTLCKKDYEITLILEEKKGVLLEQLNSSITVKEYKLSYNKVLFFRKLYNFIHKTIWKFKNKNKYDFSCNYCTYSLIGSYLARTGSKNNSLYVHSNYYESFKHNNEAFRNFFDSLSISEFKNIIFVSNESKDSFVNIYKLAVDKCRVINNLIDFKNILKLSNEKINLNIFDADTNLVFVGRLDNDSKNFKRMLKSFSIAYSKNKKMKLFLVGDGKDKNLCEDLIRKYKLNSSVVLLGEKINPYPYIKNSDCFLLTSDYEGYPVVLTESLVLNKQMISTVSVSDSEINAKDFVTIVDKDEEKIAKAICSIKNKDIKYKIDFNEINNKRINAIISLIENK